MIILRDTMNTRRLRVMRGMGMREFLPMAGVSPGWS